MEDDVLAFELSESEDDSNEPSSSEDELEAYIKKKFELCDPDNFEQEMDSELANELKEREEQSILGMELEGVSQNSALPKGKKKIKFDDSSESDDEDFSGQAKATEPSNDDLLYDPKMDDDDEKWVEDKRRAYIFPKFQTSSEKVTPLPNSDAVLNCPACMSLLCLDCQRHELYKTQYRAMFVTNCIVDNEQVLRYCHKKKKSSKRGGLPIDGSNSDVYHPVKCFVCNTEVAVIDKEEVYHFFNVLASY
ncbi:E2F-associated phosphoprotein-like [Limulus polyphemus]|uniref:E2F-associated phosphoprotein-like n=1 Tax=Limulus polyphemus TaxID=6850 RepID=A0ABM1BH79_LIMPO|nr:E2F-associated phosphoprotein-like [Limulus polyphemus]